ncbi:MAG TPA: dihydrolipoamide acetyltransferase family protein [Planctomycetaceae bacterium]|jgi:pyruvate dehydrogenase E2 component (dihydrolipoamide acetyltransferase)|nr:dihydrolipoamide acetyltransferase family protein [Planctomycetaceae bacterium]
MSTEFKLPLISEGVEAADIAAVHVHEGDVIEAGQIVLEVETEKAVAEIPAPSAGRVEKILVKQGQTVKIGQLLLTIDESAAKSSASSASPAPSAKETPPAPQKSEPAKAPAASTPTESPVRQAASPSAATVTASRPAAPAPAPAKASPAPAVATATAQQSAAPSLVPERGEASDNGHDTVPIPAGPATRRMARELGVDLHRVSGSGPGGRVTTDDVQSFVRSLTTGRAAQSGPPGAGVTLPPFDRFGAIERVPINKLGRVSAANLALAWQTVPHVTQHELADVTELEEARQGYVRTIGQNAPKVTMTAIMVKAVVGALKAFPHFNSTIDLAAGELIVKHYFHIGVAVDTDFGLLVPVIPDADRKTVLVIAQELGVLAAKARERKLDLADMQGGTFTITNLGGIGGTAFTPIVNFPEAAILGMSRTQKQLKLIDGKVVERLMLPLSLSYDHRIVNGADAARFIVKLSGILSDPFKLLIEL